MLYFELQSCLCSLLCLFHELIDDLDRECLLTPDVIAPHLPLTTHNHHLTHSTHQAAIMFQLRQFESAASILEELYGNIEPLDEYVIR